MDIRVSVSSSIIDQNRYFKFVDLESSNFSDENGKKPQFWYKYYSNLAIDLAEQGNIVFVSTHKEVRDYITELHNDLSNKKIRLVIIAPKLEIKDNWIKRLNDRYENNKTTKNYLALEIAEEFYEKDVMDLFKFGYDHKFEVVEINNTNYDLYNIMINIF